METHCVMFVVLFHRNSDEFTGKTTDCALRLSPLIMRIPCSIALNLFLITEVCGFSTLGLAPWARGVKISQGFNVEFCGRSSSHRRRDACCKTPAMVQPNGGEMRNCGTDAIGRHMKWFLFVSTLIYRELEPALTNCRRCSTVRSVIPKLHPHEQTGYLPMTLRRR